MYKKDCADQWNNIKKYIKSKMKTLLIVLKKIISKIIRSIKTIIKKIKEGWNNDMSEMDKKKIADEIEKAWERIVYIEKKVFGKEDAAGKKREVEIERYENSLKELMASVDDLNKKVDNLQSVEEKNESLKEKNESLKKENDSLKNKIKELNKKLENKDGELKTKASDLQTLREEKDLQVTKLEEDINKLNNDKTKLNDDKTKLEDELEQKKKENQNLDNKYEQIKQENEQLQKEKTMLENDLRQKVEEKEKLQHDLDEQKEKYEKTNEHLYEKEKEYEELLNSKEEMIRQWSDKTEPYRKVLGKMIRCDSMRGTMEDFLIDSKAGSDDFTNVLNFINLIGRGDTFLDTLYEDLNDYVNEKETFITEEDKEFFVALNQYYKDRFGVMFDFIFYGQERFDEKKMTDKQNPNHYFKSSMGTYVPGILNDEGILKYKEIVKGTI